MLMIVSYFSRFNNHFPPFTFFLLEKLWCHLSGGSTSLVLQLTCPTFVLHLRVKPSNCHSGQICFTQQHLQDAHENLVC